MDDYKRAQDRFFDDLKLHELDAEAAAIAAELAALKGITVAALRSEYRADVRYLRNFGAKTAAAETDWFKNMLQRYKSN
jgi:hypothetical protein